VISDAVICDHQEQVCVGNDDSVFSGIGIVAKYEMEARNFLALDQTFVICIVAVRICAPC
jgi:hypothetical protein